MEITVKIDKFDLDRVFQLKQADMIEIGGQSCRIGDVHIRPQYMEDGYHVKGFEIDFSVFRPRED